MNSDQQQSGSIHVSRVILPPFLPEDVPEPEIDALLRTVSEDSDLCNNATNSLIAADENSMLSRLSPKIRKHIRAPPTPKRIIRDSYSAWLKGRAARKREVAKICRNHALDELVAIQALKKHRAKAENKHEAGIGTAANGTSAPTTLCTTFPV